MSRISWQVSVTTEEFDNPQFKNFDKCLGALDGTHINVFLPPGDYPQYRNRKQSLSQNVLTVCNFELLYVYILPGWEGSAYDSHVLKDVQDNHKFNTPEGIFLLSSGSA